MWCTLSGAALPLQGGKRSFYWATALWQPRSLPHGESGSACPVTGKAVLSWPRVPQGGPHVHLLLRGEVAAAVGSDAHKGVDGGSWPWEPQIVLFWVILEVPSAASVTDALAPRILWGQNHNMEPVHKRAWILLAAGLLLFGVRDSRLGDTHIYLSEGESFPEEDPST